LFRWVIVPSCALRVMHLDFTRSEAAHHPAEEVRLWGDMFDSFAGS
jgi:hypothetical protein